MISYRFRHHGCIDNVGTWQELRSMCREMGVKIWRKDTALFHFMGHDFNDKTAPRTAVLD